MAADAAAPALAAWLARMEARRAPKRRDLQALRAVAERLGVLPPAPATVVVAGTNGKGSTVAFLERLLLAAGLMVGTTTSPHMRVFNERVRVGGVCASDADIVDALDAVERCRAGAALSYFDCATLAALVLIARARVDVAVLEVGLGGRLDAVNVVDADVAVITNVALDHQDRLGHTRAAIGAEKAGIIRLGKPLVLGEPTPPETVLAQARALAAPVRLAGRDFGSDGGAAGARLWLREGGERVTYPYCAATVHPTNAATALQAAALLGHAPTRAAVTAAATTAAVPGRFEVIRGGDRTWVLDVAHNPAAARFLAAQLRARFGGRFVGGIVGCMADKDVAGIVAPLAPLLRVLAFANTGTPRGQSGGALRTAAGDPAAFAGPLQAALAHVLAHSPPDGTVLVCGSFDVVARARRLVTT